MASLSSGKNVSGIPKYQQILQQLRADILTGIYPAGARLPSENALGEQFTVSRLTVQRALKELQIENLVDRRAGSGTYAKSQPRTAGLLFGLLIPGLGETEIFEPICRGMAKAGSGGGHGLLWGEREEAGVQQAQTLCQDYISRGVSGVFFAPIEGQPDKDEANRTIVELLSRAGVPTVLLDRCFEPYPHRSQLDLVGIDNRRAGYRITAHLLKHGSKRPVFLAQVDSAPTVDARAAGFRELVPDGPVLRLDPAGAEAIHEVLERLHPDGFVCANDITAVTLMKTLEQLGCDVPRTIRITGIDDVKYASLLRVPLTTLHQPCEAIGAGALDLMLSRIANPKLPARDLLFDCPLIIRQSCGEEPS